MNPELTSEEREIYEWQMIVPGFGEAGQRKLKASAALISRCGGLGGAVAYNMAAAGIGKLVLAHAGVVRLSDLNRQILMTRDWVGKPRVESAARRLNDLNPALEIEAIPENVTESNVAKLVGEVDIIFDCAPVFNERFLMNAECVRQGKPMIEAAMFCMEGQVTTIIPGQTPCLACLYPVDPVQWKRRFPVFGAVSALAGAIASMEGIKLLTGLGQNLAGALLYYDTGRMTFEKIPVMRRPNCRVCGDTVVVERAQRHAEIQHQGEVS